MLIADRVYIDATELNAVVISNFMTSISNEKSVLKGYIRLSSYNTSH